MAINDNTNYELSGSQVKDLANRINYKVNRKFLYNTTTTTTVYKKVTIAGFTSSGIAPYGVGAFIFTRKQFYVLTGVSGSGANESFYEIGTNENNEEPQDGIGFSAHIKLVYQDGNPPTNILYIALPRYGYCDIHSSGTIAIEDSDSTEWEGITADIACKPILANLTKNSGASLGSITAGANTQSYAEVTRLAEATDLNSLTTTGIYIINHTGNTNTPENTTALGTIICDFTVGTPYQIFIPDGDGTNIWKRKYTKSTSTFGNWTKIVNNGTLTIQKNGTNVQTFSANQSSNVTANIEVPTKVSDIENDLNFIEDDTTQVCDEDSDIELEETTKAPLEIKKFEGNSEQATYSGKNLFAYIGNVKSSQSGVTGTLSADGIITYSGILSADNQHLTNDIDITSILEDGQVYTMSQTESFGDACSLEIRGRKTGTTTYSYWSTRTASGASSFTVNKTTYDEYKIWIIGKTSGTTGWGSTSRTLSAKYMLEKGSPATSWEPYVGGKASPSPDYPQSISVVTGRNVVEVEGKNRFNNIPRPLSGSSLNVTTDSQVTRVVGDITSWWNLEWTGDKLNLVPGETYTARCFILDNPKNYAGTTNIWFDIQGQQVAQAVSLTAASGYQNTFTYAVEQPLRALRIAFAGNNAGVDITFCIQIEKGSTATAFEPYQSQTYEINLGKNLFDETSIVRGYEMDGTTGEMVENADWWVSDLIRVKPNSYYVSSGWDNNNVNKYWFKSDGTYIERTTNNPTLAPDSAYYMRVNGRLTQLGKTITVEAGQVATEYSEYFTPIELSRIGDYGDYIYRNGRDFYIHREIGKYIFDGSETWTVNGNNLRTTNPITDLKSAEISDMGLSDKFIYWSNTTGSIGTGLPEGCFGFPQNKENIDFRYSGVSTAADFKTWVENNTITVYYVKETPEEELITNEELISQLRDLWNATGYDDRTTITVLSYGNNSRAILSVCQYPNHIPVASQYKVGSVTVGDGLLVDDGGRISLDMSYIGTSITKISNSEIDTIMGVQ